jgi:ATP-dependent protease HslVU (ClpYQ) peptidase subunit
MTVIVAVVSDDGEIIFGADSAATDTAGTLALRGDAKVFKRDGYTIGFCGSYRVGQLVKHEMRLPAIDHEMTAAQAERFMVREFVPRVRKLLSKSGCMNTTGVDKLEDSSSFLVGFDGYLFVIADDLQVEISQDDYAAIGSGAQLALGSLHADKTSGHLSAYDAVQNALWAAERYCSNVRGPFLIM